MENFALDIINTENTESTESTEALYPLFPLFRVFRAFSGSPLNVTLVKEFRYLVFSLAAVSYRFSINQQQVWTNIVQFCYDSWGSFHPRSKLQAIRLHKIRVCFNKIRVCFNKSNIISD